MPFSRDTILEISMTLVRLSGAKSLREPLTSRLLGRCVASSPLAAARWVEATKLGYPSLVCTKQVEAVKHMSASDYAPPTPTPLVAIVDPCTCEPSTFNRVHHDWTPLVGGGPSHLLYVGMHRRVRVGVGPHYPLGSPTMANGGVNPPICG